MKFLSLVWLILLGFILTDCRSGNSDANIFTKQVEVFGLHVYATATTPDDKVLHAANVLAEYLDNDEDGIPDNEEVVDALASENSSIVMRKGEWEYDMTEWTRLVDLHLPPGQHYLLWGDETILNAVNEQGIVVKFDVSWEEILHLITDWGYGVVYPSVFGRESGTELAKAMDKARGGHFEEVPKQYPDDAWYTYYDRTCDYDCQNSAYIYWALTSILGAQDFPGRSEQIKDEWRLNTKEKVQAQDPAIYALLTEPQYKFPTVLPNGKYRAKTFMIQKYP